MYALCKGVFVANDVKLVTGLLFTGKLDTCRRACRKEVVLAKFQPHVWQMHFKWAKTSTTLEKRLRPNDFSS